MKNRVKLSESQLRAIIAESCEKVLNEIGDTAPGRWMLGRLDRRQEDRAMGIEDGKIKKTTVPVGQYDYYNRDVKRQDYGYKRAYDSGYAYQADKTGRPAHYVSRYGSKPNKFDDTMGDMIRDYRGRAQGDR